MVNHQEYCCYLRADIIYCNLHLYKFSTGRCLYLSCWELRVQKQKWRYLNTKQKACRSDICLLFILLLSHFLFPPPLLSRFLSSLFLSLFLCFPFLLSLLFFFPFYFLLSPPPLILLYPPSLFPFSSFFLHFFLSLPSSFQFRYSPFLFFLSSIFYLSFSRYSPFLISLLSSLSF
jgi:hypothetical protein